ncbi:amylo-alpha-1,6-glucosidase [Kutzneria sp. 744]|uniref:amylo-alpha-1,6-glucosidase n=1 Tax=Kutzneria sp. (strain 744) TaxID=345341 RepID=UPI0003EECC2B|nr:trehalase family glycosidase [Kutzneria sp. 744]EWM14438.1 LigA protein [Kutzneria sp. 744]
MTTVPEFSVHDIPFSHHGSWFGISPVLGQRTRADDLHLVSHRNGMHGVLRLVPVDPAMRERVDTTVRATPAVLSWEHDGGRVDIAYDTPDAVRLRGAGLGMRVEAGASALTPFTGDYFYPDAVDGGYTFTAYETGRRYRITVLAGQVSEVFGAQALGEARRGLTITGDGASPWEIAIEELRGVGVPYRPAHDFEQVVRASADAFAGFVDAIAPWRRDDTPAAELACYTLWSATVAPEGFLARPGVLMSKHWMDKVWSWDHCFNALALAPGAPELAWDQFSVIFDHQDATGVLPDSVTHSEVLYNFVKPPIHGWALGQLRRLLADRLGRDELTVAYDRLARWTDFWLTCRRAPGDPLPHYQHGNDSGWDNATTFDPERVIVTADLAGFLVLQLRELADLAADLGRPEEAARWAGLATSTCEALVDELWSGDRFYARGVHTGQKWATDSLLDLMPIALGQHLPEPIAAVLADRIATHLTPHGLASERTDSSHYQSDGYWRGPIWAPATMLVVDGLRRAGHGELARRISDRFRALCEASGFAENFDALTGAGLRDRAYTWTASVYLLLARTHVADHAPSS